MAVHAQHWHGWLALGLHALQTWPFWLALAGVVTAWFLYIAQPGIPAAIASAFGPIYRLLDNKYYLDRINEIVFAGGARLLGRGLWRGGDQTLIDGLIVNGSARLTAWFSGLLRLTQTGHLNTYAITMIIGVALLMLFVILPVLRG
jgi:NADH-quinone oxidoreductase subunit L